MQGGGAVEQIQGEIHLPPECLGHIMTFVADEDYYNAMQVSREWMAAARCSRSPFWRVLNGRKFRCKVATICRRLRGVLRTLDMRGCTTCQACMLAYEFTRHQDDRTTPSFKLLSAMAEDGGMPALEALILNDMPPPSRVNDDIASVLCPRPNPGGPAAPLFPRLRVLSFAGNRAFHGEVMEALLEACPAVREVYLGGCDVSDACIHALADAAAQRGALRANCRDRAPLEEAIDVSCGKCGAVLLRGVDSFLYNMPSQGHISRELYTHAQPLPGATAPLQTFWGGDRQLNCPRNCHAPEHRYLIDAGSGLVNRHGWACAVALSDAGAQPQPGDPAFLFSRLAIATPSAGTAAPAGAANGAQGGGTSAATAAFEGAGAATADEAAAAGAAAAAAAVAMQQVMDDLWVGSEDGSDSDNDDSGGQELASGGGASSSADDISNGGS